MERIQFDGKDYFTIYDFVKAYEHFNDPEWDGEPGEPEPEMRGSYSARGVMFNDPNEYVRSRKGTFVQQYDSRLDSLRLESDLIDHRDDFVQKYIKRFAAGRRTKYHVVWSVERSTSRRHPHWKKKTM